jgi:hypothetical protein
MTYSSRSLDQGGFTNEIDSHFRRAFHVVDGCGYGSVLRYLRLSHRLQHFVGIGNTSTFTVTGFSLTNANQIGGGNIYQPGDVDIDIATGGPTTGSVFLANLNRISQFTVNYTVTLSTAAAGTVPFDVPAIVSFGSSTAIGNAFLQSK